MAAECQRHYKDGSKKDLLRKSLQVDQLHDVVVDLVQQQPTTRSDMNDGEELLSPGRLYESVSASKLQADIDKQALKMLEEHQPDFEAAEQEFKNNCDSCQKKLQHF